MYSAAFSISISLSKDLLPIYTSDGHTIKHFNDTYFALEIDNFILLKSVYDRCKIPHSRDRQTDRQIILFDYL